MLIVIEEPDAGVYQYAAYLVGYHSQTRHAPVGLAGPSSKEEPREDRDPDGSSPATKRARPLGPIAALPPW